MLAFPFFWYLREDSIWLLPLYIVATICTFFGMIVQNQPLGTSMKEGLHTFWHLLRKTNKQKLVGNLLLLIAPILLTLGESLAISKMNQNYYGIFTTNDRTKTSFAKLTEKFDSD